MDTGRAGTIYGASADDLLGKSWFAKHGYMPRGDFKLEALHEMPEPDYEFLGSGASRVTDKGQTSFIGTSGHVSCIQGWTFGANYTKALFILAHAHGAPTKQFLFLHDAEPTDRFGAGAKGIGLETNQFTGFVALGTILAASGLTDVQASLHCTGWTTLAGMNAYIPVTYGEAMGLALYVDTAGSGVVKLFARFDFSQWIEVASVVSAHLAGVIRCASFIGHPNSGGTIYQLFGCPMGIYAE